MLSILIALKIIQSYIMYNNTIHEKSNYKIDAFVQQYL